MPSVLVAYATKYGSTQEVAEAVGSRLRDLGLEVEVSPVTKVRSAEGHSAVVLGTPFYIGSMLKGAREFLEKQRTTLEKLPVALFSLGPISADDLESDREQLDKALAAMPWLKPVAAEMFVGAYDPSRLRLADKLVAVLPASPLHGVPASDGRDWAAIEEWTDGLPAALGIDAS